MRLSEIIQEKTSQQQPNPQQQAMKFERAWTIWVQGTGKNYSASEQSKIQQRARAEANRGADPMDAISTAADEVRNSRQAQQSKQQSGGGDDGFKSSNTKKISAPKFTGSDVSLDVPGWLKPLTDPFKKGMSMADKWTKVNKK